MKKNILMSFSMLVEAHLLEAFTVDKWKDFDLFATSCARENFFRQGHIPIEVAQHTQTKKYTKEQINKGTVPAHLVDESIQVLWNRQFQPAVVNMDSARKAIYSIGNQPFLIAHLNNIGVGVQFGARLITDQGPEIGVLVGDASVLARMLEMLNIDPEVPVINDPRRSQSVLEG